MTNTPIWQHPNGYQGRGLRPVSIELNHRGNVSGSRLREKLERWEHRRGNTMFEAVRLETLPTELSYELANVWVALRERFPEVRASQVNFAERRERGILADAVSYRESYPLLRQSATYVGSSTPLDTWQSVDDDLFDRNELRQLERELRDAAEYGDAHTDVTATGAITLSSCLGHESCYKALLRYWERRNARAIELGRPVRVVELGTSAASYVFIHEFGHLVDASLAEQGEKATEQVYAALSQGVLGGRRPRANQWRENLWNYPVGYYRSNPGRYEGGETRRRENKHAMRWAIADRLGTYAAVNRDELFAEAFSLSYCAKSVELRDDLRHMRDALVRTGVAVQRRS
jgi:hypothetical protein